MSLNKMSCWEILELELTSDKKSIKKAYHKLLRKNKPDEKPDEFKILYQAYQDALEYDEENTMDELSSPIYEEDVFTVSYEKKLDEFIRKVNERTYQNNDIELFNNISNWNFIEEFELEKDVELYGEASMYLFEAVSEFENKFSKDLLSIEVIVYLNDFFLWKKNQQKYDKDSIIFEYLDSASSLEKIVEKNYPLVSYEEETTVSYQKKLDEFIKKVNERTYQNNYIKLFNNMSSWDFIEEFELNEDKELYEKASVYLFESVTVFEKKFSKELLNMEVILYFSNFFLWKKQWQKYDKDSAIFEYLYSNNTLKEIMPNDYPFASLRNRALAFGIDIGLVTIVISLLGGLSLSSVFGYYILLQIIIVWSFDLPTPGNFISKLKVFEGHHKIKTTRTARGIRIMIIGIMFLSFSRLVGSFPYEWLSWIGLINIGLLWKYEKMIQDFFGTRVYDMSGFEKD